MKGNKLVSWILFFTLCLVWGSSFILMKISKQALSGAEIASLRIFSAGIVLVPFGIFHLLKIPRQKILPVITTGLTGNLLPAFFYAVAIANNLDSSLVAILNSLTPISVVLIGMLVFRNKIKYRQLTGIFIGFTGLCLLFLSKGLQLQGSGYALLVLVATVSYGFTINVVNYYLKDIPPLHVATVSLSFMVIPTFIILWQQHFFSLPFADPAVQRSVYASVFLGIAASSVGTILFYILIRRAGGLFASLVTYGVPFIATIWGLIDGELITAWQIGCLVTILAGVYLANR